MTAAEVALIVAGVLALLGRPLRRARTPAAL